MADFVVELTRTQSEESVDLGRWMLYMDGLENNQGCGARVLLISQDGSRQEYAFRFKCGTSNNEAEYEALLAWLRLTQSMGARHVSIIRDPQLVVN